MHRPPTHCPKFGTSLHLHKPFKMADPPERPRSSNATAMNLYVALILIHAYQHHRKADYHPSDRNDIAMPANNAKNPKKRTLGQSDANAETDSSTMTARPSTRPRPFHRLVERLRPKRSKTSASSKRQGRQPNNAPLDGSVSSTSHK